MSDNNNRSPLLSIAASLAATIKCCSNNVATDTTVIGNHVVGDPTQTVAPLVKTASSMSIDIVPIVDVNESP